MVHKLAKIYHRNCHDQKVREEYWKERSIYKNMIRSKKRKARVILHSQLLRTRLKNPREFWKIVTEHGGKKADDLPLSVSGTLH